MKNTTNTTTYSAQRTMFKTAVLWMVLLLVSACVNLKPYEQFKSHVASGRPELAEAIVDSMEQAAWSRHARSTASAVEKDSTAGWELGGAAVLYNRCGAYRKGESAARKGAELLASSVGRRHPDYLKARYDQAYAILGQRRRQEAIDVMAEVRDALIEAPMAGGSRVGLSDLVDFYHRADAMPEMKQVVVQGLANTQPGYANVRHSTVGPITGAPQLWDFDRVRNKPLFARFVQNARGYDMLMGDPIWAEQFMLLDRAFERWYDGSPKNRFNSDLTYAYHLHGAGMSTRAMTIGKRAYQQLAALKGMDHLDYAIGATNHATHMVGHAINHGLQVPFAYLDSIYEVDCPKLGGKDLAAKIRELNCRCAQTELRSYAAEGSLAEQSMSKARGLLREIGIERERIRQYEGWRGNYTGVLLALLIRQKDFAQCDSLLSAVDAAPYTTLAWRNKFAYWRSLLDLHRGKATKAVEGLQENRAHIERFRASSIQPFAPEDSRDMVYAFDNLDGAELTALLHMGGQEKAIQHILDSRKLSVMKRQIGVRSTQRGGYADQEFETEFNRRTRLRQELVDIVSDPRATPSMKVRAVELEDSLHTSQQTLALLDRTWIEQLRSLAPEPESIYTVEKALQPTAAVLDIHRVQLYDTARAAFSPTYLMLLRRHEGAPTVIGIDDADRIDRLVRMVNALHTRGKSSDRYIKELSDALMRPLEGGLSKITRLYICGDGGLSLLNWTFLWDGTKRLCETRQVQHVHGMHALRYQEITGYFPYVQDAAFFGDPVFFSTGPGSGFQPEPMDTTMLPGRRDFKNGQGLQALPNTRAEVEEAARIVKEAPLVQVRQRNVKTYLGYDALESRFKGVGTVNLLHIATHGYFEEDPVERMRMYRLSDTLSTVARDPMLMSGLLLNGSGDFLEGTGGRRVENGLVSAAEIEEMDLSKAELVVLSACLSGQGAVATADGVDGLQRGFFIAGAKAVMVSFWKVDDTFTTLFMKEFYKRWTGKEPHADAALRSTQLHFMAKKEYASPRYWASFAIISR